MEHTQADDSFAIVPHRTRWYHKDKTGAVQNAGVLDSSYKIPGGGLISSADDMANFEVALLAGKLLKPATQAMMWTVQRTPDGITNYALGWAVPVLTLISFQEASKSSALTDSVAQHSSCHK
jgi:serine beta-lactamase-like protein LACTB